MKAEVSSVLERILPQGVYVTSRGAQPPGTDS